MEEAGKQDADTGPVDIRQLFMDMEERMSTKFEAIEARLIAQDDKLMSLAAEKAELSKQLELQSITYTLAQ